MGKYVVIESTPSTLTQVLLRCAYIYNVYSCKKNLACCTPSTSGRTKISDPDTVWVKMITSVQICHPGGNRNSAHSRKI